MGSARILVVEDVRHLAHFAAHHLRKAGYETCVVHHGDEVLDAAAAFRPHAVLLDVMLPGACGPELCRAMRADPAHAEVKILFVTGHAFEEAPARELWEAGADYCFSKPLSPVAMLAKLKELGVPPAAAEALP